MNESAASNRPLFRVRRVAFWGLVLLSIGSLIFAPLQPTIERVKTVGPWVGLGLLVSEALFIAGLAIMAATVGVRLGLNPFRWRHHLGTVLAQLDRTPLFWAGLAVNTVGALGTGVVALAAIVSGLPPATWGLLVVPLADLSLTAAVRVAVVGGVRGRGTRIDQQPT